MSEFVQTEPLSGKPQDVVLAARRSLNELLFHAITNHEEKYMSSPDASGPVSTDSSVARCCKAYTDAMKFARSQGKEGYQGMKDAKWAYRNAMPSLSSPENIRNFIACIAHAMLLDVIDGSDGARLLYAAQVAHSALEKPSPGRPGRPPASQTSTN